MLETLASDGRIGIRRFAPSDLSAFYAAIDESRGELGRWMPWMHDGYTIADTADWIARREDEWNAGVDFSVLVVDAAGGVLGASGFNQINREHRIANLGYWVRTSATRRGVASAAARLTAAWGFRTLGIGRAEIVALRDNTASCRAAQKSGARFEGHARNRLLLHGRWHDAAVYAFVPGDFA
ncbi:MAG: GNAT family N-acetyltransferase [Burkholderiales bacterium]|nr:GNAT family N-acetyltransferase [Burkholderiales bacterium]MCC7113867.1 GNAT family N-acetyltransferase [Burkholderiales bacterium]